MTQEQNDSGAAELDSLREERAHLLEELEMAYRQMEVALEVADYERQVAYGQLRQRNDELQSRLLDLERAHAQLREAQHMLVRSERLSAMGHMAAAIVHEINNPLTVIGSYVELLLEEVAPEHHGDLQALLRETQRMHDLARNVLHFARQRTAEMDVLDLVALVGDVLNFFKPLVKRVRLSIDPVPADFPKVRGSGPQLEQVLTNFLVNARDVLVGQRGAEVNVALGRAKLVDLMGTAQAEGFDLRMGGELAHGATAAGWVYVQVSDNGSGISAEVLDSIFEPFFTTKGEGGTGLGLSICQQIAEVHGGHIAVASRVADGASTRCWLLLPPYDANTGGAAMGEGAA